MILFDFQNVLGESVIVHTALHRAMCEVHPGFDAIYSHHYDALKSGAIGTANRQTLAEMLALIEQLDGLKAEG